MKVNQPVQIPYQCGTVHSAECTISKTLVVSIATNSPFYITEFSKQSDSKLEKFVSLDVLKEEKSRDRFKWRFPCCHIE